jgi:hypothetical protein
MRINLDTDQSFVAGELGDVGDDKSFHVPAPVYRMTRRFGMRTAESLYDLAKNHPSLVAELLDWTETQVSAAVDDLAKDISRMNPEHFSVQDDNPFAKRFGFGAMPPTRSKEK